MYRLGSAHVEVYERRTGENGELVLRGDGRHFEIISNGVFLMDTRAGESERLLVRAALERAGQSATVLIGGLGVGFSLAEALRSPRTRAVTVVEREPAVIAWHATYLRDHSGGALDDARVRVERADLLAWLRTTAEVYDVVCLDVDNGPEWTVTEANAVLYGLAGLDLLAARLRPGGVLAVWSAGAAPGFEKVLRERFAGVSALAVPVARGEPDVVYLASSSSGVVLFQLGGAVLGPAAGVASQVACEEFELGVPGGERAYAVTGQARGPALGEDEAGAGGVTAGQFPADGTGRLAAGHPGVLQDLVPPDLGERARRDVRVDDPHRRRPAGDRLDRLGRLRGVPGPSPAGWTSSGQTCSTGWGRRRSNRIVKPSASVSVSPSSRPNAATYASWRSA